MNINKTLVGAIIIVFLAVLGFYFFGNNKSDTGYDSQNTADNAAFPETQNSPNTNNLGKEPQVSGDTNFAPVGSYEVYSPEKIAEKSKTSRVVLFFNATWCPTCRGLDRDIKAHLKNIPGDITILSVDYDTYKDLERQYGVTYQHTLVQVDADGKLIKKWSGSSSLVKLVGEVQ